jgi:hypothetical protein
MTSPHPSCKIRDWWRVSGTSESIGVILILIVACVGGRLLLDQPNFKPSMAAAILAGAILVGHLGSLGLWIGDGLDLGHLRIGTDGRGLCVPGFARVLVPLGSFLHGAILASAVKLHRCQGRGGRLRAGGAKYWCSAVGDCFLLGNQLGGLVCDTLVSDGDRGTFSGLLECDSVYAVDDPRKLIVLECVGVDLVGLPSRIRMGLVGR